MTQAADYDRQWERLVEELFQYGAEAEDNREDEEIRLALELSKKMSLDEFLNFLCEGR